MKLDVAMRTDKGVVREQNEDAVGGDPDAGLLILADGMGGANAGEVASSLTVEMLMSQLAGLGKADDGVSWREHLLNAIQDVNQAIQELSQQVSEYQGMGTTLVVGLFTEHSLLYAHVGDSRLYRLRAGVFEQMTTDHTMIQEMVNLGDFASIEQALMAGVPTNVLSRAIGSEEIVDIDLSETELDIDDLYLFCSDGLTGMMTDDEIQSILENRNLDLMQQADELVDFACRMGGVDNITVILARTMAGDS
ncbi:PP2C family protein-serine/threonine phosphatase [Candidatus Thiodiazotropha sp. CDECU1]|uniref:PP2C family protein-serine/threonine phosphatase n=1 Tax=Candidatus Thiodiazotropha sp. CDECU1 TaxID=3065865 RepID=UPI00293102C6|nr:protein phosphatase 2C domain-containing protein [Candidatus Thiodiazotropha sp. CDECU1]